MKIYTVHLPVEARDPEAIAGALRVVPEAGSFLAFLFGPLWLIWHRAWAWGIAVGVVEAGLAFVPDPFGLIANLLFSLLIALEGHQLVRLSLSRGKWRMVEVVNARDSDEAQSIALARLLAASSPQPSYTAPSQRPVGTIGLFPQAGA